MGNPMLNSRVAIPHLAAFQRDGLSAMSQNAPKCPIRTPLATWQFGVSFDRLDYRCYISVFLRDNWSYCPSLLSQDWH
jgi:hypothetical protein